jgi:hypothetical protein
MNLPEKVWVIGKLRPRRRGSEWTHYTPFAGRDAAGKEVGLAPLTILDSDGERAMPVYSTRIKAEMAIERLMTDEEKEAPAGSLNVDFDTVLERMSQRVQGAPHVDYVGVDMMGKGRGQYALVRL